MVPHQKTRSRRYSTETITDEDNAGSLTILANSPAHTESRLHSLEQATGDISLYVNANKTESMCFKQENTPKSLKFVDKYIYLGSNILPTESDINIQLVRIWNAIDRLSVIWKSDLSDKIKRFFFKL